MNATRYVDLIDAHNAHCERTAVSREIAIRDLGWQAETGEPTQRYVLTTDELCRIAFQRSIERKP